ncbi:MAG: LytTR family DNA-binding domain-containing protein [Bacteroidota bacterium]
MLNKQYSPVLNDYKTYFFIGVFVSLFVLLFQPFGMQAFESSVKSLILLGYGGIVFLALSFSLLSLKLIRPHWFDAQNWTMGKQLILTIAVIISISLSIYGYSIFCGVLNEISFKAYSLFLLYSCLLGIFPLATTLLLNRIFSLEERLEKLEDFKAPKPISTSNSDSLYLIGENKQEVLRLKRSDLIYIESRGNYVKVAHYQSGKVVYSQIRSTLENVVNQVEDAAGIMRVHRAFILNLYQVGEIWGNSKKLRLHIKDTEVEIPVSRSYIKAVRGQLDLIT